ncbi:MAG: dihydrodipicolinate synthase family protein, partial [SAR202 cluster bacterium]|nr:dihydrodipicolinate synthase family protein [SAR202 cluster bacterium]
VDKGVVTGNGTLLVGGAGGEHPTMNVDERKSVMAAAVKAANGQVPVLTSIQHTDVRVVLELAEYASGVGLHGVQLGPTYYYEPSEDDVVRLFQYVSEGSDVNLMIYHTWWEGLTMSISLIDQLSQIKNVNAMKWSAPTVQLYREGLVNFSDKLVIIDNGGEHVWSNVLGAAGFITHLSGFWPEYPSEIWDLLKASEYDGVKKRLGDFKWKWREWITKVIQETGGEGPFIKAAMERVGLPAGPPRPPSVRPPEHLMAELDVLMKNAGTPIYK